MSERAEKIAIILAAAGLLAVVCSRGKIMRAVSFNSQKNITSPTAENLANVDSLLVGDSGTIYTDPVSPTRFANTRFVPCIPTMPARLRQTTVGHSVPSQICEQ